MTVLEISRTAGQKVMADTELTADNAQRQVMEAILRGRGYSRNQHGFYQRNNGRTPRALVITASY